jgi:GcrA cell cycle regulator
VHGIYYRSAWTVEREARLKELWESGLSASQCAERLGGGATRNAVIGKVSRLGLSFRDGPVRPRKTRAQVRRQRGGAGRGSPFNPAYGNPPPSVREIEPLPPPQETDIARISFNDIDEKEITIPLANGEVRKVKRHCKFRIPTTPPDCRAIEYCGDQRMDGLPYCEAHAKRAYGAPPPRQYKNIKPGGMLIRVVGGMKFEEVS